MDEEMRNSLGQHADALAELAVLVREQMLTGIESLTGSRPALSDVSFGPADATSVEAEFTETPHAGIVLALVTPGGERQAGAILVPLLDLGALIGIETGEDRMADADFAEAQLQVVAGAAREFFDLMGMTLFVDALGGVEVAPAGSRLGDVAATLSAVSAHGATVRIDVGLTLLDGLPVHLVLLLPRAFLDAVGAVQGTAGAPDAEEPEAGAPDAPFGLDADLDKISPFPRGGTHAAGAFADGALADAEAHPVRFPPLGEGIRTTSERRSLDLLMDVSMRVTVELGRSSLTVEEVLSLGPGSVVELNKLAGEPVDVLVNDQLIARGEVVVVDENFGVRVTEIVSPRRRAQAMGA